MAKKAVADEVMDLTADVEAGAAQTKALSNLRKNMEHLLISAAEHDGPELDFGDAGVLYFQARVPVTAMVELVSNDNHVAGLQAYIRAALKPESRDTFDELQDKIPLDALNAIVEAVNEATTPFDRK